jgi:DNA-binding transcriptional LysR family regulator
MVQPAAAAEVAVAAPVQGLGVVYLFEDWLRPHFESGALAPVLQDWWESFPGPSLYFPSRRLMPAPLRAFVDFIRDNPVGRSSEHR